VSSYAALVDLVREFEWTRPRHQGWVEVAAPIFGTTPGALEKQLRIARRMGIEVEWTWTR